MLLQDGSLQVGIPWLVVLWGFVLVDLGGVPSGVGAVVGSCPGRTFIGIGLLLEEGAL